MLLLRAIFILTFTNICIAKKDIGAAVDDTSEEDVSESMFLGKKPSSHPTSTKRPTKGEVVVEKFVETLMTSEKYLRMIETVDKKLNHLDSSFHDKSTMISKYLTEILKAVKSGPTVEVENTMRTVKAGLNSLTKAVADKMSSNPSMRVDARDQHLDGTLDARLSFLEGGVKSIQTGVESIVGTITEVKNRQHSRTQNPKNGRVDRSERYPTDCHEIQMQGFNVSGIYKIKPDDMDPFYVLCDLTTAGGSWTVFQNRFDGSQDFYKSWTDYKYGFGNLAGEFWLGLDKLHFLTNQKLYEMRVEVETQHGHDAFAGYSVFTIGPEHEGYRISTLGTFYGTAGDSLSYHAGQKFSSNDVDNDDWKDGSCAVEHGGAWWYKECDKSNLNGMYALNVEEHRGQTIYWISFKGPNFPLTKTKMMIRPLPASRPLDFSDQNRKITESSDPRSVSEKQIKPSRARDSKARAEPYRFNEAPPIDSFFTNYA